MKWRRRYERYDDFSDWCARHVPIRVLHWYNVWCDFVDTIRIKIWRWRNF